MRIYVVLLMLVGSFAYANNQPPAAVSQQGQLQGQAQGQAAIATSSIAEGAVQLNAGDNENTLALTGGTTTVTTKNKRNAPSVSVIPSPTTAEMMVCFGLGGSGTEGAAVGAWCRLQRELYAGYVGDYLASMGDYENGAAVYCSRKMHYRMFNGPGPGEQTCRDQMTVNYANKYPPVVYDPPPPQQCTEVEEKLNRCEIVNK